MNSRVPFFGILLICFVITSCSASGEDVKRNYDTVILRGIARVVGNEPFTRLVLTVQGAKSGEKKKDYVITGTLEKEIWDQYQGRVIVVEGRYCEEIMPERLPCIEPVRIIKVE
jgi:hypothetical protein